MFFPSGLRWMHVKEALMEWEFSNNNSDTLNAIEYVRYYAKNSTRASRLKVLVLSLVCCYHVFGRISLT